MKTLKTIAFMLAMGIVAVGCGNVEKILPKKGGEWTVTSEVTRYYTGSTLDSTITETPSNSSYTFQDDNTGTYNDNGDTGAFTWTINDDGDKITICEDFQGAALCLIFDILESSNKAQTWTTSIEDFFDPNNHQEIDINFERAE